MNRFTLIVVAQVCLYSCFSTNETDTIAFEAQYTPEEIPVDELAMNCEAMDILFVIDDSASMGNKQDALMRGIKEFSANIDTLKTREGLPLDLQFGVTTTSLQKRIINPKTLRESTLHGSGGKLVNQHCYADDTKPWKISEPADLSCLTNVGLAGSNIEMPLESIKLVAESGKENGFMRDEALFAIAVITDEDDCSYANESIVANSHDAFCDFTETIEYYAGSFDRLKNDTDLWVSWVVGDDGACDSNGNSIYSKSRLEQFSTIRNSQPAFSSICEDTIVSSLNLAFEKFARKCHQLSTIE